ncbi:MAG: hypothetical protein M0R46_17720 [Candidatus Muirbacterium halophilum]|nr:hypothetical protein [Candidatus Muirbacterium halophilum]
MNNIKKYAEFILEMNDTPESLIEVVLNQIKRNIDKMFEFQEELEEPNSNEVVGKSIEQAKKDSKDKTKLSFKDLGVRLESSEISKYSQQYDSLTIKFSDDNSMYNLYLTIDIKDALPDSEDSEFTSDDIKKCFIKFKKYDLDTLDVVGQITKNADVDRIDEDFLIDLKIEIDEKFGDDEEFELEIED